MLIELVQLHDETPSAWKESAAGALTPVLIVDNLDTALHVQPENGRTCISRGTYGFGARFALVETPMDPKGNDCGVPQYSHHRPCRSGGVPNIKEAAALRPGGRIITLVTDPDGHEIKLLA